MDNKTLESINNFIGKKTSSGIIKSIFNNGVNPLGLEFLGMGSTAIVFSKGKYAIKIYKRSNARMNYIEVNGESYCTCRWGKDISIEKEYKILKELEGIEGRPKLHVNKGNYIVVDKVEGLTIEELLEKSYRAANDERIELYMEYLDNFNLKNIYYQFKRLALEIALRGYLIKDAHIANIVIDKQGKVNIIDVGGFVREDNLRLNKLREENENALIFGYSVREYLSDINSIKEEIIEELKEEKRRV